MSDALNPSGPSQPTLEDAYTTAGNPAETTPQEKQQANATSRLHNSAQPIDRRGPYDSQRPQESATPSSLARGIHGPESSGKGPRVTNAADLSIGGPGSSGRTTELDAEQMAAPGEGKVAEAVRNKSGASSGPAAS